MTNLKKYLIPFTSIAFATVLGISCVGKKDLDKKQAAKAQTEIELSLESSLDSKVETNSGLKEQKNLLEDYKPNPETLEQIPSQWDEKTKNISEIFDHYRIEGGNLDKLSNKDFFKRLQAIQEDYKTIKQMIDYPSWEELIEIPYWSLSQSRYPDNLNGWGLVQAILKQRGWIADDDIYLGLLKSLQTIRSGKFTCCNDPPTNTFRAQGCKKQLSALTPYYHRLNNMRKKSGKKAIELSTIPTPHGTFYPLTGCPSSKFDTTELTKELLYRE